MIKFKDFVPAIKVKGGLLRPAKFGKLKEAIQAANDWLDQQSVEVLNVETVVLPNIHNRGQEGSGDVALGTVQHGASWHQFVRIWYRE